MVIPKLVCDNGCARVRPKNSAKEGKVGMIRGVRATLVKMVTRGDSPISHKLRMGGTEDQQWSQTTKGTVRFGESVTGQRQQWQQQE